MPSVDRRGEKRNHGSPMATVKCSAFVGTSLDGFIARLNGDLDFLPADGGEPHGYNEFISTVDVIIIGRKTFETVLSFPDWPYGKKQVIVLSNRKLDFSRCPEASVEQMSGDQAEILRRLGERGFRHAYVDGGITLQGFLRAGLIQHLTLTRVPVLIGEGVPLFGTLDRDLKLRHVATHSYATGLVKSEYEIDPGA
jgi:dihydrofolate reductase